MTASGTNRRSQPHRNQDLYSQGFRSRCISLPSSSYFGRLHGLVHLDSIPVLVELNSSITGFTYNSFASTTGGDLRFFAADGEELPYEIETWNPTGTSRFGALRSISGTNTVITAWGDSLKPPLPPMYPMVQPGLTDTTELGTFKT